MKIFHYSLGLPPFRSGGLTRYSVDLMDEEVRQGHSVFLLYPQNSLLRNKPPYISKGKKFKGIEVFALKNALPVPLMHGVRNPSDFIEKYDQADSLECFLGTIKPDVLHVHTLMGLSPLVLKAAKKCGVKIVFTSHDYYGLCLRTNFVDSSGNLCFENNCDKCAGCNRNAKSSRYLYLRNSPFLLGLVKKWLKGKIKGAAPEQVEINPAENPGLLDFNGYKRLLRQYREMFLMVDSFHFNSEHTFSIYKKYLPIDDYSVIPITHKGIKDNRKIRTMGDVVRFGFVGPLDAYKGFPLLKNILIRLFNENLMNWQMGAYGSIVGEDFDCPNIKYCGKFRDPSKVYSNMDMLVVPSLWNETFSFVTTEALSYGTPVLVSSTVGAKDIVKKIDPDFIFSDEETLYTKLKECLLHPSILQKYNEKIMQKEFLFDMKSHAEKICEFYQKV